MNPHPSAELPDLHEQMACMVRLARSKILTHGDLEPAFREILQTAARLVRAERVGIWLFSGHGSRLRCVEQFESVENRFSRGAELTLEKYPRYFAALENERTITSHDARNDPRTSEFTTDYLEPLGISSLLDAAIRLEGKMIGVVCHEHVGSPRRWTLQEQNFAGSMGDFVALAMEASERKRIETLLRELNRTLEQRVRRRTEELTRANLELAERNEELQQFLYVASHDLQEPLRAVAGYCELLKRRYRNKLDAEADEFIDFAVDGANRMKRLVNGLLELSRVGTHCEEPADVDVRSSVDESLDNLHAIIQETRAIIDCEDLPTIVADRSQMVQLFQNLIGNAVKYRTDRVPEVRIDARREEGGWLFSVCDNGIGIPHEQTGRIFDLFQRLHGRDEYPGTGIGLAICRKIVNRHGGRIWAESDDGGSTFYFTLPDHPEAS